MARDMQVSDSVLVGADAETIWTQVADPTQMPRWSPENTGAATGTATGPAARRRGLRRGQPPGPGPLAAPSAWSPPRSRDASSPSTSARSARARPRLPGSIASWSYTFEPVDGGTRVTETWQDRRRGWPDRVAAVFDKAVTGGHLFSDLQRRNIARTLARLKADFEGAAPESAAEPGAAAVRRVAGGGPVHGLRHHPPGAPPGLRADRAAVPSLPAACSCWSRGSRAGLRGRPGGTPNPRAARGGGGPARRGLPGQRHDERGRLARLARRSRLGGLPGPHASCGCRCSCRSSGGRGDGSSTPLSATVATTPATSTSAPAAQSSQQRGARRRGVDERARQRRTRRHSDDVGRRERGHRARRPGGGCRPLGQRVGADQRGGQRRRRGTGTPRRGRPGRRGRGEHPARRPAAAPRRGSGSSWRNARGSRVVSSPVEGRADPHRGVHRTGEARRSRPPPSARRRRSGWRRRRRRPRPSRRRSEPRCSEAYARGADVVRAGTRRAGDRPAARWGAGRSRPGSRRRGPARGAGRPWARRDPATELTSTGPTTNEPRRPRPRRPSRWRRRSAGRRASAARATSGCGPSRRPAGSPPRPAPTRASVAASGRGRQREHGAERAGLHGRRRPTTRPLRRAGRPPARRAAPRGRRRCSARRPPDRRCRRSRCGPRLEQDTQRQHRGRQPDGGVEHQEGAVDGRREARKEVAGDMVLRAGEAVARHPTTDPPNPCACPDPTGVRWRSAAGRPADPTEQLGTSGRTPGRPSSRAGGGYGARAAGSSHAGPGDPGLRRRGRLPRPPRRTRGQPRRPRRAPSACSSAGEVGELVEGRVDADEGELALDDGQVGAPDVGEDAAQVAGGVVPALARGARAVGAAAHGGEHDRLAGERGGRRRRRGR